MSKIFIYGHRHTGTTILRKIIGSHSEIYEYPDEVTIQPKVKGNVVFKYPGMCSYLQDECKRVNIIKNPYDVFGSLRLRFGDMSGRSWSKLIDVYAKYVEHFVNTTDIKIQYEELFDEGNIETLFMSLGFKYEGIKNTKAQISSVHTDVPNEKPESQKDGEDHARWRMWQINQPLKDMTGESAKHLQGNCEKLIRQNEIIRMLYD